MLVISTSFLIKKFEMKLKMVLKTILILFTVSIANMLDAQCWYVDDGTDSICQTDPDDACVPILYPDGSPAQFIEALSIDPSGAPVYAADGGQVGILDPVTGTFTPFANASGYADLDGLAWDPSTNKLYASIRSGGNDELVCIETTGPNAGLPVAGTEVEVTGSGSDVDELTVPPNSCSNAGTIYATISTSTGFVLATIDPVTGAATEIGPFGIADVESITFDANCNLYANTGSGELYLVDQTTGEVVGDPLIDVSGNDVEGMSCETSTPFGASISNFIWEDLNGDGVQDPGESGIAGIVVNLLDPLGNPVLDPAGNPITATTDSNGEYMFDNLPAGDYTVQIDPSNFLAGGALEGYAQTYDEDGSGDGEIDVMLDSNEDHITADFGFQGTASISNQIWEDIDGDGLMGPGETGIPGVIVNLLDDMGNPILDAAGNPVTTTTNADGEYIFENLPPGDYNVEIDPSNFVGTGALAGYTQTYDEDGVGDAASDVTLGPGEDYTTADFGFSPPALPVEFVRFTATKTGESVLLDWSTGMEINNDRFKIEHSSDGRTFSNIGEVSGAGTSSARTDYKFVHDFPKDGTNLYRIMQVDYNGTSTYSEIRAIEFSIDINRSNVYPNPFGNTLNIDSDLSNYQIFNSIGKLVKSGKTSEQQIDMSGLNEGSYYINLFSNNEQKSFKIIKR